MIKFTYNKILILFIALGLLSSLIIGYQRHMIEEANKTVELIVEYNDVEKLALFEGVDKQTLLEEVKKSGITSLAISEVTLEQLEANGYITIVPGYSFLDQKRIGLLNDPFWKNYDENNGLNPEEVYIIINSSLNPEDGQVVFSDVKNQLESRLKHSTINVILSENNNYILSVKSDYKELLEMKLGLLTLHLKEAERNGFYIVARPTNYPKVNEKDIDLVFNQLAVVDKAKLSSIVFAGKECLGYPNLLPYVADKFKENNISLGLIEHAVQLQFYQQEGLIPLATSLDYQVVRLYSIDKAEQLKLDSEEAIRRHGNTDRERNIRLNLIKPFVKPDPGKTLLETNLDYIQGVKDKVVSKGFSIGKAEVYQVYFPPKALLSLTMFGTISSLILLLSLICPLRNRYLYLLTLLLGVIFIIPVLLEAGTLARKILALSCTFTFPVIAVIWYMDIWQIKKSSEISDEPEKRFPSLIKTLGIGIILLIIAGVISLIGGIYLGALLSDIRFFLEIQIFSGVKLSFIAPLIAVTLAYIVRINPAISKNGFINLWKQTKKILEEPLFLKTVFIIGVALIAVWVFLGRSGHTAGIPVPGIEIKLRIFLEEFLYARPRGKEFLIGHPAFLLSVLFAYYSLIKYLNWPKLFSYFLILAATIGQASITETFAHLRTPIYMSIIRGVDGLLLGIVIGTVCVIAFYVLLRIMPFFKKEDNCNT